MRNNLTSETKQAQPLHSRLVQRMIAAIRNLFRPEEVEVTFTHDGNITRYTYTKVNNKQAA